MAAAHLLQIGIQRSCRAGIQADAAGDAGIQIEKWFFPVLFFYPPGQYTEIIFNRFCRTDPAAGTAFNAESRVYGVLFFFCARNRMGRADGQAIGASDA
jgi:hypothetical protein